MKKVSFSEVSAVLGANFILATKNFTYLYIFVIRVNSSPIFSFCDTWAAASLISLLYSCSQRILILKILSPQSREPANTLPRTAPLRECYLHCSSLRSNLESYPAREREFVEPRLELTIPPRVAWNVLTSSERRGFGEKMSKIVPHRGAETKI